MYWMKLFSICISYLMSVMNVEIFSICACTDVIFPIQLKPKEHPPGRTQNFPLNVFSWPSIVITCQSFLLSGGTSAVFVQYAISTGWWRTWRTRSPSGASSRTLHGTRRCSRNGNLKSRYSSDSVPRTFTLHLGDLDSCLSLHAYCFNSEFYVYTCAYTWIM